MIELPRTVARQARAVFRRCCARKAHGPSPPAVEVSAGAHGLRLRLGGGEVLAEFEQPGRRPPETLCLPLEALDDFGGRGAEPVLLEAAGGQVLARWQDAGVPQEVEYAVPDLGRWPAFPAPRTHSSRNPPELLGALDEAAQSTAAEGARYAVQRVLLRGRTGEVVATDGRQLLVQGGFAFPWQEDLLVPRVPAFGCKELAGAEAVEVGRADDYVVVRAGPWAFSLSIDGDARYPKVEQVIPAAAAAATRWRIDPGDAAFLLKALPRLPGGDDEHGPLTVDLDDGVHVRARAASGGRTTEVVLARSGYTGQPVRLCVNRKLFARALALGFTEVQVVNGDTPLVCRDGRRTFVAMPLPRQDALEPSDDALRLVSAETATPKRQSPAAAPVPNPRRLVEPAPAQPPAEGRKRAAAATAHANGGNGNASAAAGEALAPEAGGNGLGAVLQEAQQLKEELRGAYGRAGRLLAALKRHRQQTRLLRGALTSLRQLQRIDS